MVKRLRLPKFWVLATAQLAALVFVAAVWFYFRTSAYLAGPPEPDLYAWSWEFQWFVFAVYWLPALLVFAGIVLAMERSALAPLYASSAATPTEASPSEP
jgi:hypothetical protein